MAKYYIKRACGHDDCVQIFGPMKDRPRQEEWEKSRLCRDCWEKELVEKHSFLPVLTGKSEKQVSFAMSLRAKLVANFGLEHPERFLSALARFEAEMEKKIADSPETPTKAEKVAESRAKLSEIKIAFACTDASAIIDLCKRNTIAPPGLQRIEEQFGE